MQIVNPFTEIKNILDETINKQLDICLVRNFKNNKVFQNLKILFKYLVHS